MDNSSPPAAVVTPADARAHDSRVRQVTLQAPTNFSYDRIFWMAYAANTILVTANALTFRFAELIAWLGGTERTAGFIVSVGVTQ